MAIQRGVSRHGMAHRAGGTAAAGGPRRQPHPGDADPAEPASLQGREPAPAGPRSLFGPRPTVGAAAAAKSVAEDASALIRAEIALAKAELMQSARAKATGVGLVVGAAVCLWLALQGLLLAAGFALALVLPGWAASLIVGAALLLIGGILGLVGKRLLATPVSIETTRHNVEEDVAWTKAHLSKR